MVRYLYIPNIPCDGKISSHGTLPSDGKCNVFIIVGVSTDCPEIRYFSIELAQPSRKIEDF